jgi:hypothetical protein
VSQTLTSVAVSPATVTVADGTSQQFSATAVDQFGRPLVTQPSFTWTEAAGSAGSVSSTGLYTAPSSGSGTATVQASAGGVTGTASVTTVVAAPAAPTNLSATASSSSSIKLSWTGSAGATSYLIERSPNGSTWTQIGTTTSTTTSYTDTGLASGTTYYYGVVASNSAGNSPAGNTASATTAAVAPPAAPTNLTAKATSSSKIALSWTGVAGATSYLVMRSLDGKSWTQVGTMASGATSFTDSGLASSTTYYYCIIAVDSGGDSPDSNIASATTPKKGK